MKAILTIKQLRKIISESIECDSEDKSFRPNVNWMRIRYTEMNEKLFRGELGDCNFEIFFTGAGSGGNTLGTFSFAANDIRYERRSRRLFVNDGAPATDRTYIDRVIFDEVCEPLISLNGNYTGTERAFLNTFVHEMCHYYTYKEGLVPMQAHGREFKAIAREVSERSEGLFNIQRLADAEEMTNFELDSRLQQKQDRRDQNRMRGTVAVFSFFDDGEVHLTLTKSNVLIDQVLSFSRKKRSCRKVVVTDNPDVIKFLFDNNCSSVMRTMRYYEIGQKPWLSQLVDRFSRDEYKYVRDDLRVTEADDDSFAIPTGMNLSDESPMEI